MKTFKALGVVVGLSVALASVAGCAADVEEGSESTDGELVRTTASKRGSISFTCKDWDQSCRQQVSTKLIAAKAKAPRSVLRAIDQAVKDPGYTLAHSDPDPDPEPWHQCGSFEDNGALVSWCCSGGWVFITCDAHMDVI